MRAFVTRDAGEFAGRVGAFLLRRPVEHNVLATVLAGLRPGDPADGGEDPGGPVFGWVEAAGGGGVEGAALRTPPRPLLASTMGEEAAGALMPRLLEADPGMPGVTGPQPAASHLADAFRRRTGGTAKPAMRQAIYWLSRVEGPPRLPPGGPRVAAGPDRGLMVEWARAFSGEVGAPVVGAESEVDRRMGAGALFVWDHDGAASMVGASPPVAGVVRLGPVYTPPAARRRGYATALVADVSRRALAAGATRCMLYADLANPTSDGIYRAVGYRRAGDAREYRFGAGPPGDRPAPGS